MATFGRPSDLSSSIPSISSFSRRPSDSNASISSLSYRSGRPTDSNASVSGISYRSDRPNDSMASLSQEGRYYSQPTDSNASISNVSTSVFASSAPSSFGYGYGDGEVSSRSTFALSSEKTIRDDIAKFLTYYDGKLICPETNPGSHALCIICTVKNTGGLDKSNDPVFKRKFKAYIGSLYIRDGVRVNQATGYSTIQKPAKIKTRPTPETVIKAMDKTRLRYYDILYQNPTNRSIIDALNLEVNSIKVKDEEAYKIRQQKANTKKLKDINDMLEFGIHFKMNDPTDEDIKFRFGQLGIVEVSKAHEFDYVRSQLAKRG